jgi:hypothetical protein
MGHSSVVLNMLTPLLMLICVEVETPPASESPSGKRGCGMPDTLPLSTVIESVAACPGAKGFGLISTATLGSAASAQMFIATIKTSVTIHCEEDDLEIIPVAWHEAALSFETRQSVEDEMHGGGM